MPRESLAACVGHGRGSCSRKRQRTPVPGQDTLRIQPLKGAYSHTLPGMDAGSRGKRSRRRNDTTQDYNDLL